MTSLQMVHCILRCKYPACDDPLHISCMSGHEIMRNKIKISNAATLDA